MWVVRNRNNTLYMFYDKPYREQHWRWVIDSKDLKIIELKDEDYPQFKDLKWEDEPIEVDIMPSDFRKKLILDIKSNIRRGKYDGELWKLFDDLVEICG